MSGEDDTPEGLVAAADRIAAGLHDIAAALRSRPGPPSAEAFGVVSVSETVVDGRPPSRLALAAALARNAARVLDAIDARRAPADELAQASECLADALMAVAAEAQASGSTDLPGIDAPSRHGAQLDRRGADRESQAG